MQAFNIQQTYVDKNDPWAEILDAAQFSIRSTANRQKGYSPGQLVFSCGTILPIKHRMDWKLICQKNQTQINKDNTR